MGAKVGRLELGKKSQTSSYGAKVSPVVQLKHEHEVALVVRKGHWFCDTCHRRSTSRGNRWMLKNRYRCDQGCSFDQCQVCVDQIKAMAIIEEQPSGYTDVQAKAALGAVEMLTEQRLREQSWLTWGPQEDPLERLRLGATNVLIRGSGDDEVDNEVDNEADQRASVDSELAESAKAEPTPAVVEPSEPLAPNIVEEEVQSSSSGEGEHAEGLTSGEWSEKEEDPIYASEESV